MSIVFKFIKRIIIILFSLLVAAVAGFLIWRIASSDNPKSMEALYANEALCSAYENEGDGLYMFRQNQRSITSSDKSYGYFSITDYTVIPSANQIQATIRYNNSTLRHTAEDFGLESVPERGGEVYDVTLVFAIDLTPENKDDNLGNDEDSVKMIRCHGEVVLSEEKNVYNFRKMVFYADSAELELSELLDSELLLAVYADFYYCGAVDYGEEPYGTLCLYDFKSENVTVKLQKNDVKAIKEFDE